MAVTSKTTLKTYFETGDVPTEVQFAALIDSFLQNQEGTYTSDATAAAGGVDVGDFYILGSGNIYGLPAGIVKQRTA